MIVLYKILQVLIAFIEIHVIVENFAELFWSLSIYLLYDTEALNEITVNNLMMKITFFLY